MSLTLFYVYFSRACKASTSPFHKRDCPQEGSSGRRCLEHLRPCPHFTSIFTRLIVFSFTLKDLCHVSHLELAPLLICRGAFLAHTFPAYLVINLLDREQRTLEGVPWRSVAGSLLKLVLIGVTLPLSQSVNFQCPTLARFWLAEPAPKGTNHTSTDTRLCVFWSRL